VPGVARPLFQEAGATSECCSRCNSALRVFATRHSGSVQKNVLCSLLTENLGRCKRPKMWKKNVKKTPHTVRCQDLTLHDSLHAMSLAEQHHFRLLTCLNLASSCHSRSHKAVNSNGAGGTHVTGSDCALGGAIFTRQQASQESVYSLRLAHEGGLPLLFPPPLAQLQSCRDRHGCPSTASMLSGNPGRRCL